MKIQHILLVPISFVAGIVSIVLLERMGLVGFNQIDSAYPAQPTGRSSDNGANDGTVSNTETIEALTESETETSGSAVDTTVSNALLSERIDALQQQLRSATVQADLMQAKINTLEQKIETGTIGAEFLPGGQNSNTDSGETLSQREQDGRAAAQRFGFNSPDNDVQYTSLISAGVDPSVAEQIKQRSDQWTLQRLELIDQATREGWRRSEQFDERISALREQRPSIREELGDADYDQYLFVSGEFNRVQIANIIDGSAAQLAGMQNGDVVLSYANQRVFTLRELQQATSEGSRGEPVQLEVIRSGEPIVVELPRGPMGVTLTGTRIEPAPF